MASSVPYNEIKNHLVNNSVYKVIDYDEIEPVLSQYAEPFIALEEILADEEQIGFGNPMQLCHQENGIILVNCFTPSPHSSAIARDIADHLRGLLRLRVLNGVRVIDVGGPDPGSLNDGLWSYYSFPVDYSWEQFYMKP